MQAGVLPTQEQNTIGLNKSAKHCFRKVGFQREARQPKIKDKI